MKQKTNLKVILSKHNWLKEFGKDYVKDLQQECDSRTKNDDKEFIALCAIATLRNYLNAVVIGEHHEDCDEKECTVLEDANETINYLNHWSAYIEETLF